jgi:imidazole glycerol-phosphate synthase subunit HisF
MLRKRIIPILLLKDDELIKSTKFKDHQYVGDPINAVRIFNEIKVDEIILLDIFKSKNNLDLNYEIIKDIADECRMPFTYGGGIKNLKQVEKLFLIGVEKISINTAALEDEQIIKSLSNVYGSQSVVISIDIKEDFFGNKKIFDSSKKKFLKIDIIDQIQKYIDLGAGEILINNVSKEGTLSGFDFSLLELLNKRLNIPIILNGGINSYKEINLILENENIDAVGVGAFFIYYGPHRAVLISYMPDDERK